MTAEEEAHALRVEWTRLRGEQIQLKAERAVLERSGDLAGFRTFTAQLHRHLEQLHTLIVAMEKYHQEHGPIGDLHPKP